VYLEWDAASCWRWAMTLDVSSRARGRYCEKSTAWGRSVPKFASDGEGRSQEVKKLWWLLLF